MTGRSMKLPISKGLSPSPFVERFGCFGSGYGDGRVDVDCSGVDERMVRGCDDDEDDDNHHGNGHGFPAPIQPCLCPSSQGSNPPSHVRVAILRAYVIVEEGRGERRRGKTREDLPTTVLYDGRLEEEEHTPPCPCFSTRPGHNHTPHDCPKWRRWVEP
ncbi:hypothetical protein B7494_g7906 [Chlorociboria aeruginascens]|nr:hypothetical protein B7494_g7906 [Chlorociboria aeruginascens]